MSAIKELRAWNFGSGLYRVSYTDADGRHRATWVQLEPSDDATGDIALRIAAELTKIQACDA